MFVLFVEPPVRATPWFQGRAPRTAPLTVWSGSNRIDTSSLGQFLHKRVHGDLPCVRGVSSSCTSIQTVYLIQTTDL